MHIMTKDGWKPIHCEAVSPQHVPSLTESMGIPNHVKPGMIADRYCAIVNAYLRGEIDWERSLSLKSAAIRGQF